MPRSIACAECGTLGLSGKGSLPEGRYVCWPCRRRRRDAGLPPPNRATRPERVVRERGLRGSSAKRGYGYEHRLRRRALLPLSWGTPCGFCGELMVEGQRLDLDHSVPLRDDPSAVGDRMVHSACNRGWNRRGAPPGPRDSRQPCPMCGTPFRPKIAGQRTCSRACGWQARRMLG